MANEYARLLIDLVANTWQFTGEMQKATGSINRIHDSMKSFAKTMMSGVAAYQMLRFGKMSVQAFSDFDSAISQSAAVMTDVNGGMRAEMEKTAITLSKTTATSATDLGKAYYYLASAGLDVKRSIAALPVVEEFAAAGMFDMAKSTELLMDSLSALGMKSEDAQENMKNMARISDVLVKANTLANASVEQFSAALTNKFAASLRMLNKDVEEGVAVLAAFAEQGLKGEAAGVAGSIVLRDLEKAANMNAAAWQRMGLSVYDSSGKMLRISDIIKQLEVKFGGMSDQQKKATATLLGFQDKSFGFIKMLMGMSGSIDAFEEKLDKAGGTTHRVASKQMAAFSMEMKNLKNQAMAAGIEIGAGLSVAVLDVTAALVAGLEVLGEYTTGLQELGKEAASKNWGFLRTTFAALFNSGPIRQMRDEMERFQLALKKNKTGMIFAAGDMGEEKPGARSFRKLFGDETKVEMQRAAGFTEEYIAELDNLALTLSEKAKPATDKYMEGLKKLDDAMLVCSMDQAAYDQGILDLVEALAATDPMLIAFAESAEKAAEERKKLMDEGARLAESLQTPREKLDMRQKEIDLLHEQKAISDEIYMRAQAQLYVEREQLNVAEMKAEAEKKKLGAGQFVDYISAMGREAGIMQFTDYIKALFQGLSDSFYGLYDGVGTATMGLNEYSKMLSMTNQNMMAFAGGGYGGMQSFGMQIMDISAARFQAPGVAATMTASEAANMRGGVLEDIGKQQLTTQKNIETGINQMNYLLARGLI